MHKFSMPEEIIARVVARVGRAHPFDKLEASKTAFVVIDMQNYYLKPGYLGDVPLARGIVPAINKFAADLRDRGAHVIVVKNASNDTRENWSVFHEWLMSPEFCERRYATLDVEHEGHQLWAELDVKSEDTQIVKRRLSAYIQGSSDIFDVEHQAFAEIVVGVDRGVRSGSGAVWRAARPPHCTKSAPAAAPSCRSTPRLLATKR